MCHYFLIHELNLWEEPVCYTPLVKDSEDWWIRIYCLAVDIWDAKINLSEAFSQTDVLYSKTTLDYVNVKRKAIH